MVIIIVDRWEQDANSMWLGTGRMQQIRGARRGTSSSGTSPASNLHCGRSFKKYGKYSKNHIWVLKGFKSHFKRQFWTRQNGLILSFIADEWIKNFHFPIIRKTWVFMIIGTCGNVNSAMHLCQSINILIVIGHYPNSCPVCTVRTVSCVQYVQYELYSMYGLYSMQSMYSLCVMYCAVCIVQYSQCLHIVRYVQYSVCRVCWARPVWYVQ